MSNVAILKANHSVGLLLNKGLFSMAKRKLRQPPRVGTVFEKKFNGKLYRLTVVKAGSGIGYRLGNDTFRTPSGAAKSITGNESNGWVFWSIEE